MGVFFNPKNLQVFYPKFEVPGHSDIQGRMNLALPNGFHWARTTLGWLCSPAHSNFGDRLSLLLMTGGPRTLEAGLPGNCGPYINDGLTMSLLSVVTGHCFFCRHAQRLQARHYDYCRRFDKENQEEDNFFVAVLHWRDGDWPKRDPPTLKDCKISLALNSSPF